ncbi:MAG TPA: phosphate ABC transporter permease PstC, partial [Candidatus Kryptonia bacterium]|nr:phosphate ABC transporter permease PstC [Candidatus Kryptonia bacterium]
MVNGIKSSGAELSLPLADALAPRMRRRLNFGDRLFGLMIAGFALLLVAVLVSIGVVLAVESMGSVRQFGWEFLTTSSWDPVAKEFGALPFIYGTIVSSILALLQAV